MHQQYDEYYLFHASKVLWKRHTAQNMELGRCYKSNLFLFITAAAAIIILRCLSKLLIYVFTMVAFVFILNKEFREESFLLAQNFKSLEYESILMRKKCLKSCLFKSTSYPPCCALKAIFISYTLRIYFAIHHL